MEKKENGKKVNPTAPTVSIDYIKNCNFRAVRSDGVIGGITPNGHIHMAFFSERNAIPRRVIHEIDDTGQLGEVREMETRNSIVREMDVDVFMNIEAAQNLRNWLDDTIKQLTILSKQ